VLYEGMVDVFDLENVAIFTFVNAPAK